jgi:hypothetical protein
MAQKPLGAAVNMFSTECQMTFAPRCMKTVITLRKYVTATLRFTLILCKENTILRHLVLPQWRLIGLLRNRILFAPNFVTLQQILLSCDRASWQILIIKPTRCTNFSNLFCNETLNVSDSSSVHHQELFTVHTALVFVIQFCRQVSSGRIRMELHPDPADDGQSYCPKHLEFHYKILRNCCI